MKKTIKLLIVCLFVQLNYGQSITTDSFTHDWDYYYREVDEKMSIIYFNKSFLGNYPVKGLEEVCEISWSIKNPMPNGLPDEEEKKKMFEFELYLLKEFSKLKVDHTLTGSYMTNGLYTMIVYSNNSNQLKKNLKALNSNKLTYEVKLDSKIDSNWEIFEEYFLPNVPESLLMKTRLDENNNEDYETLRVIEHIIYFTESAPDELFIDVLKGRGLILKETKSLDEVVKLDNGKIYTKIGIFESKMAIPKNNFFEKIITIYQVTEWNEDALYLDYNIITN